MGQFLGIVALGSSFPVTALTKNTSGTPKDGTSGVAYRIYGPTGLMNNGTGSGTAKDSGSLSGATNASPIVITSAGHGLTTGTRLTVSGVLGNTAANGDFTITAVDSNTFSLDGSTGNASYTSGGSWHVAGLYTFTLSVIAADGYASGQTYSVYVAATVSGTLLADLHTFTVV